MAIDRVVARSWSKDRIREEIADLRRTATDIERDIHEDNERYSTEGYRNARWTASWGRGRRCSSWRTT